MKSNTLISLVFFTLLSILPSQIVCAATAVGPKFRRPMGENLNCRPDVRKVMGGNCHCIKNATKENIPPYTPQPVSYAYLCSSNHLRSTDAGDVCIQHADYDLGDPVGGQDLFRPDVPPFGIYTPWGLLSVDVYSRETSFIELMWKTSCIESI